MTDNNTNNTPQKNNRDPVLYAMSGLTSLTMLALAGNFAYTGFIADENKDYLTQNINSHIAEIRHDFKMACLTERANDMISEQLQQSPNINVELKADTLEIEHCMKGKATTHTLETIEAWDNKKSQSIKDAIMCLLLSGLMFSIHRKNRPQKTADNKNTPKP